MNERTKVSSVLQAEGGLVTILTGSCSLAGQVAGCCPSEPPAEQPRPSAATLAATLPPPWPREQGLLGAG